MIVFGNVLGKANDDECNARLLVNTQPGSRPKRTPSRIFLNNSDLNVIVANGRDTGLVVRPCSWMSEMVFEKVLQQVI